MKPEIKEQWISALRSGEYKQGHGALRTECGYCCLGVLTDLAVRAGVVEWKTRKITNFSDPLWFAVGDDDTFYDTSSTSLIPSVIKWAGLSDTSGDIYVSSDENESLSSLNDHGVPFDAISDIIEAQL